MILLTIGAMAESKKAIEKDVNFQQMMKKNIKILPVSAGTEQCYERNQFHN